MASPASSPSQPLDDEPNLDQLVSELHSLKKLYALLKKNSVGPSRPDEPTAHLLDEKSKHLLKKLLDGATQQALQSQAKIISSPPESPKSQAEIKSNPPPNDPQKDPQEKDKYQECHPAASPENPPVAEIVHPVEEPEITQKECPLSKPIRPNRRRQKDASVHRRGDKSASLDRRRCPSKPGSRSNSSQLLKSVSGGGSSTEKAGDLLALVPVQKRARVEPPELRSRVSSRTRKPGRVDRVLTHQKITSRKEPGAEPNRNNQLSNNQGSKSILLSGNRKIKPAPLNQSKAWRNDSSDESTQSSSVSSYSGGSDRLTPRKQSSRRRRASPAYPPPQRVKQRSSRHQTVESKSRATKPINPACSTRFNSDSTRSTRSGQLTPRKQSRVKTRRTRAPQLPAPKRPAPFPHLSIVPRRPPPPRRPEKALPEPKQEKKQGKLKRLTNKLAIIFHHHHHHHHHLHAEEDDDGGRKEHERSLWKYLKAILHARRGGGEERGKRHGYLGVMMEGFLRHLWGMRQRRRKKVESRRGAKKVKWWEWFRRRGGVVVGGRRRFRLRLGFNGTRGQAAGRKRGSRGCGL